MSEPYDAVADYESMGCTCMDHALGIQKMPEGYHLMLDADEMFFFWLRRDGAESAIHWSKWAVYRGAKADAARLKEARAALAEGGRDE